MSNISLSVIHRRYRTTSVRVFLQISCRSCRIKPFALCFTVYPAEVAKCAHNPIGSLQYYFPAPASIGLSIARHSACSRSMSSSNIHTIVIRHKTHMAAWSYVMSVCLQFSIVCGWFVVYFIYPLVMCLVFVFAALVST